VNDNDELPTYEDPTVPRPITTAHAAASSPVTPRNRTGAIIGLALLSVAIVMLAAAIFVVSRKTDGDVVAASPSASATSSSVAAAPMPTTTAPTTSTSVAVVNVAVAIADPAAGAVLNEAVPTTFTATVQPVVAVANATLLVDGAEAARGPNPTLVWVRPTQGNHSIAMHVVLADGRSVTSPSVLFSVQTRAVNPPPSTTSSVTAIPATPQATGTNAYTNVDDVNFRTEPSLNAHIMTRISAGTSLVALCIQHGDVLVAGGGGPHSDKFANDLWIYTRFGGEYGWVTDAVMNTGPDRENRTRIPAC